MNTQQNAGAVDMDITPSREQFRDLVQAHRVIPVRLRVLADEHTPLSVYHCLSDSRPGTFLMESAAPGAVWDRHSFIGVSSAATLSEVDGQARWIGTPPNGVPTEGPSAQVLEQTLAALTGKNGRAFSQELGHLSSGLVGYIGWDTIAQWEKLPHNEQRSLGLPAMAMNIISDLAVYDNRHATVTLISNIITLGADHYSLEDVDALYDDAVARLHGMQSALRAPLSPHTENIPADLRDLGKQADPATSADPGGQTQAGTVRHSWAENEYLETLSKAQQAITDGEVFQIVVSRRFEIETDADALSIYRMLRLLNPSPYMYLMHFQTPSGEPYQVIGASPEALVTVDEDRQVVSHPIAGTRPRGETPAHDQALSHELLRDEKERSEHVMLVDLARNDLAKVCEPGSVEVTRFMSVEYFSHVMHLTSHVSGRLAHGSSLYDVLAATFPAGTLSGAPKPRALQLLTQWEPTQRGIYGGVVGYFDFSGRMDTAIAIRSVVLSESAAYIQSGGGIVADSDHDAERLETVNKAAAPIRAVLAADELLHQRSLRSDSNDDTTD